MKKWTAAALCTKDSRGSANKAMESAAAPPKERLMVNSVMNIRLLKRYPADKFTFEEMNGECGIFAVRGPCGVPHGLSNTLKQG